jgi:hypothetical protein
MHNDNHDKNHDRKVGNTRLRAVPILILGVISLSGCASGASEQEAEPGTVASGEAPSDEKGRYFVFSGEFDQVLLATRSALLQEGYDIRGDYDVADGGQHVFHADKFPTPFDAGTILRVQVERPEQSSREGPRTVVRVFTTRRIMSNLEVGGDASEGIFRRIHSLLRQS